MIDIDCGRVIAAWGPMWLSVCLCRECLKDCEAALGILQSRQGSSGGQLTEDERHQLQALSGTRATAQARMDGNMDQQVPHALSSRPAVLSVQQVPLSTSWAWHSCGSC